MWCSCGALLTHTEGDQGQRTESKGGSRYINRAAKGGATELRANGLREQGQSRGRIKGLHPTWIQGRSS